MILKIGLNLSVFLGFENLMNCWKYCWICCWFYVSM